MINLPYYYEIVESAISCLGLDPSKHRGEKPGQWNMQKGSAFIWVDVFVSQQNQDYGYCQILAPISKMPADVSAQHQFLKEALEINHDLYGVGFTVFKDYLYIKVIRELEGLSMSEALAMLKRIGTYADDYDDHFTNKYFGRSSGNRPSIV